MMKLLRLVFLLAALTALSTKAAETATAPLMIAAAADLRDALPQILAEFQAQQPSDQRPPQVIYGSSGKISSQMQQGAPYQLFFSADRRFTEPLYRAGLTTDAGTWYASGRLVLWSAVHDVQTLRLQDLTAPRFRHLAIAQPAHAPYGERAQQALTAAGVWSQLQAKLVYGENIAQTAQMAQSGAADVAIIALSLVKKRPQLAPANYRLIDTSTYQPLQQTYALTHAGAKHPQAAALLRFMQSARARQILLDYGFALPQQGNDGSSAEQQQ